MYRSYSGLPAAASVEQAILMAQHLILSGAATRRDGTPARAKQGTFPVHPAFHQR
jgi:hypothetical protein